LVLAAIGQRFRFSPAPDHSVEILPALSLRPRSGVRVVIQAR
jgi:hypothetical protein